ncbi:1,4-dihydroxy-2-naphthoate polyprenyltransferase [Luteococcus sp. Sow4_B9]|uniref:1,4-dihydroxy-2-naphthoate polyprenyltransferase n=1 Tax=Luteococcus sp. Sow4_B9 TaxID=3438792 RepID=UPI003F94C4F8
MATVGEWIEGARPRTLPAALSPVLAGSAVAWFEDGFRLGHALLAFVVALALQIGVNFANDYSDGIRGTDEDRVGPMRLVGSGAARPAQVKAAAFGCFGLAAVAGLVLVALTGHWWLIAVGLACIIAAWYYTGGEHPYGYAGLGEVFVFIFFGLVAVCGTTYVQIDRVTWASLAAAVAIGTIACQILVTNNLRDIVGDREVGKRTLATRLGDAGTRRFFAFLTALVVVCVVVMAGLTSWWVLLGLATLVLLLPATRTVLAGATGKPLIGVLKQTGIAELLCAVGIFVGCVLG